MARLPRTKKATGFLNWFIVIIGVIGLAQIISTKRQGPPPQQIVPAPAVQAPPSLVGDTPVVQASRPSVTDTPSVPRPASRKKLATHPRPGPDAKTPSTPRSHVLFNAGRNVDQTDENYFAIYLGRRSVTESRRTPESGVRSVPPYSRRAATPVR